MELKRCVRCGTFLTSNVDVCKSCEKKDLAELGKLKGFFADSYVSGISKGEISNSTGISVKNLNRYLGYDEFSGIYVKDDISERISDANPSVNDENVEA